MNILTVISVRKVFNFLLKYVFLFPPASFLSFLVRNAKGISFLRLENKQERKSFRFGENMFRLAKEARRIYSSRVAENALKWRLMRRHKFVSSCCGINRVNHSAMNLDKARFQGEMGVKYRIILHSLSYSLRIVCYVPVPRISTGSSISRSPPLSLNNLFSRLKPNKFVREGYSTLDYS